MLILQPRDPGPHSIPEETHSHVEKREPGREKEEVQRGLPHARSSLRGTSTAGWNATGTKREETVEFEQSIPSPPPPFSGSRKSLCRGLAWVKLALIAHLAQLWWVVAAKDRKSSVQGYFRGPGGEWATNDKPSALSLVFRKCFPSNSRSYWSRSRRRLAQAHVPGSLHHRRAGLLCASLF